MPFKSQAQRAYMHIHHPRIAAEFEDKTPKGKKLPQHVPGSETTEKHSAFYGHGVAQAMLDISMVEKVAWPWSGGQGVSTIAQNYHPDTVTRARNVEQGQAPSVPRPSLPPQIVRNAPPTAAPAAATTPAAGGDPMRGATGQQRNRLALDAGTWR